MCFAHYLWSIIIRFVKISLKIIKIYAETDTNCNIAIAYNDGKNQFRAEKQKRPKYGTRYPRL